ncbi:MAG: hypothetical protein AAB573_01460 [Patescibacteria group bacterium]
MEFKISPEVLARREREMDALYGKARPDGSRMQSFGVRPEFRDGKWMTVYVTTYDNGTTHETVHEKERRKEF